MTDRLIDIFMDILFGLICVGLGLVLLLVAAVLFLAALGVD